MSFSGVGSSPLRVPYCYYPKNFEGYRVLNQTSTGISLTAYLERVNPSGVDDDIKLLRVEVIPQTNFIVRIRILAPIKRRWEPPLPVPPAPTTIVIPDYVVEITNETRLEVRRYRGAPSTMLYVKSSVAGCLHDSRGGAPHPVTFKVLTALLHPTGQVSIWRRWSTPTDSFRYQANSLLKLCMDSANTRVR